MSGKDKALCGGVMFSRHSHFIVVMETSLKKLATQEQKYSAELDKALAEYADLKAQVADIDSLELYEAQQAIRPAREKTVEKQLEKSFWKKTSLSIFVNVKQERSRLLGENAEEQQIRQLARNQRQPKERAGKDFER